MNTKTHIPWLILRTKSRQENVVAGCLQQKAITAYLPKRKVIKIRQDRRVCISEVLFPGYIFVQPRTDQVHHLSYIPGSCGLLVLGNQPAKIPQHDLDSVRIMANSGEDLRVDSELIPGRKIEVLSGPFSGVRGELVKIKNRENIIINAAVLGKSVKVEIHSERIRLL